MSDENGLYIPKSKFESANEISSVSLDIAEAAERLDEETNELWIMDDQLDKLSEKLENNKRARSVVKRKMIDVSAKL